MSLGYIIEQQGFILQINLALVMSANLLNSPALTLH